METIKYIIKENSWLVNGILIKDCELTESQRKEFKLKCNSEVTLLNNVLKQENKHLLT